VALIEDPGNRMWRTGSQSENSSEIYAMLHNDISKPSRDDVSIGVMNNAELAENVVDMHNRVLRKFGRHYPRALKADD
jgi:hypothetical protein